MKRKLIYLLLMLFTLGCSEDQILSYDTSRSSLNIAKGFFTPNQYPESYYFNAYFLGIGAEDYTLKIPVRLSGLVDQANDREYALRINPELSKCVTNGREFSLTEKQIFRRGMAEDSIEIRIHIAALNKTDNYRIHLELVPNKNFEVGIPIYQYVVIDFMRNVNTEPPFWTNNSKLSKFAYHPEKGAKFLEISKITDPNWIDKGTNNNMDYWIQVATQWFENNEVIDTETGNRIYFNQ